MPCAQYTTTGDAMKRRTFLRQALAALPAIPAIFERAAWAGAPDYSPVASGQPLKFPRDYGAHPDFHIEWWYVTGWLEADAGTALGFQLTFFRSRPALD